MYIINFISQGRLLPKNLMLAGFTVLPCASKQEEDYYLVFSSYHFRDIKMNESYLKRIRKKMYILNFISQGRLLPKNLMLAGFTVLPCASKQEEDYYLMFSNYYFIDIKKNESHGLRM